MTNEDTIRIGILAPKKTANADGFRVIERTFLRADGTPEGVKAADLLPIPDDIPCEVGFRWNGTLLIGPGPDWPPVPEEVSEG